MKKYILIIVVSCMSLASIRAQNEKYSKVILHLSSVDIEGWDEDNMITFYPNDSTHFPVDPKATGLKPVYMGRKFAYGVGMVQKGSVVEFYELKPETHFRIKLPRNVSVLYICHKKMDSAKVICKNLTGEIEIESDYNDVSLENVTGPVIVRTLYGSVNAVFTQPVKNTVSISSMHASVDLSMPATTQANVKFKSPPGNVLASPEFKIAIEKSAKKELPVYGDPIKGTINGGGVDLILTAEYDKIYLRKI